MTVTKPAATGRALRDTWDLPFSEASQAVLADYIEVPQMATPPRTLVCRSKQSKAAPLFGVWVPHAAL